MAMSSAEKVRAFRERKRAAKAVEPGDVLVLTGGVEQVQVKVADGFTPEALCALVDELYMAGAFRGSLARIRLRAFAGK